MDESGRHVRREDVTQLIAELLGDLSAGDPAAIGPDAVADAIVGALEERGYAIVSTESTDRG